jgi:hypothetical protein
MLKILTFGVVVSVSLCGCNVIPRSGIIGAHAISGDVLDATTGLPVQNAQVCVRYQKLSLRYYVRGLTSTDANGHFAIAASPEHVRLLDDSSSVIPSVSVTHPKYDAHMSIFRDFSQDTQLTIKLNPRKPGRPDDPYITCSDSAIAPRQ